MIYITGDTHRDFSKIETFCAEHGTTKDDVMIVLGDAGINFYGGWRDENLKDYLDKLSITFFFIHGNHEMRPETIPTYTKWYSDKAQGFVYWESRHPQLYFAVDGESYFMEGLRLLVCGGAYSVDKEYRLSRGWSWWPDEQPNETSKANFEEHLRQIDGRVDYVLTHTCPVRYEPVEVFLPMIDQSTVDKSTERW